MLTAYETRPHFNALATVKRHWSLATEDLKPLQKASDLLADAPPARLLWDAPEYYASGRSVPRSFAEPLPDRHILQGPELVQITMPRLGEGGRIGLAVEQQQVTSIMDPSAAASGFAIGDRICSINNVSVANQDQFRAAVKYAVQEYASRGTPLTFLVAKAGTERQLLRRERDDCCAGPAEYDCCEGRPNPPPEDAWGRRGGYHYSGHSTAEGALPPFLHSPSYADMEPQPRNPSSLGEQPYGLHLDTNGYSRRQRSEWAC